VVSTFWASAVLDLLLDGYSFECGYDDNVFGAEIGDISLLVLAVRFLMPNEAI